MITRERCEITLKVLLIDDNVEMESNRDGHVYDDENHVIRDDLSRWDELRNFVMSQAKFH